MSLRPSRFLAVFLACAPVVHAVRPAPVETPAPAEPAKADSAPKDEVPPYVLKKRSTFSNPDDVQRAPFWPIGWVKRNKGGPVASAPQVQAPKVVLDGKSFKVTSIMIGSGTTPSLAVINARAYSEGEFLRMPKTPGATPVRIRVQRINDGNVVLQNGDQTLVANLTRPELSNPKPEELLNDKDR
ncbi:MAG: hypothetical protein ABJF10_08995 [Chthoniobacter sp.]|uniref:hypothetical protein n=1 Tax=Chthoniobacter sp. TaxID=2510640 RepID=UPI0032A38F2C